MTALSSIDVKSLGFRLLFALAAAWLAIFAIAYFGQRRLMYVPSPDRLLPNQVGLSGVSQSREGTPDGAELVVWQGTAKPGRPTIIYFHGNGGALAHRHGSFQRILAEGYGLTAFSYRGYSGSTGIPSEQANVADALLIYDRARASGIAARDIILFGESLGSGVAVQVAANREAAAVVLESPYSSVADVAAHRFWFLPARFAIKDTYDSITHVQRVKAPLLILAGTTDTIIPVMFSKKLAAAAPGPKSYIEYPNAWHVNTFDFGGFDAVRDWITKHHK